MAHLATIRFTGGEKSIGSVGGEVGGIVGKVYVERGEPVTVICQWAGKGPRNVCVERADGSHVVRPFRGLRKLQPGTGVIPPVARREYTEPVPAPTSGA